MCIENTYICLHVCMNVHMLNLWRRQQWSHRTTVCDKFVDEGEGNGSSAGNTNDIDVTNGFRSIASLTCSFFYSLRLPKLACF